MINAFPCWRFEPSLLLLDARWNGTEESSEHPSLALIHDFHLVRYGVLLSAPVRSEDCAARRLHVAELLARYPKLLRPLLLERRVHISGMALLYAIITDENAERLINEAAGKSRRDIDEMRARERPKEDISTGMKRQPALNCESQPQTAAAPAPAVPTPAPPPVSKNIPIEVRSPNRHAYRTMLSDETRNGYQRVQDLTGKNDEEIFADMVKVYEAELLKR